MKKFILAALVLLSSQFAFAVTEITEANFKAEVEDRAKAGETVVIKFYATWCGACKAYAPEFEKAEKDLAGKAKFFQIDVDKNPKISGPIQAIPTTLVISNKRGIAIRGGLPAAKLEEVIAKVQSAK